MNSFEDVMATVIRLQSSMEVLGALGARLNLMATASANPEVEQALDDVLKAAEVPSLESLAPEQVAQLGAGIKTFFAQARDLVANSAREPGWSYTDPDLLDGQGKASMLVPQLFRSAPELDTARSFLDIGTGVGWMAIAITRLWPEATVTGIDTYELALEMARSNVKAAGLDARITLRSQDVSQLDETDRYDAAWLPSFFIARDKVEDAVSAVLRALRPGGVLVLGRYEPPPVPVAQALFALRTLRDGGSSLGESEARALLASAGCADVRELDRTWKAPVAFAIGRKG